MPAAPELSLCVLGSSSAGNCSALVYGPADSRRMLLIDAGFSPKRTRALLAAAGLGDVPIAGLVFTHLDIDHCHAGCAALCTGTAPVYVHRRHLSRAGREGLLFHRTERFDSSFEPLPGLLFEPTLAQHDDLGTVAFRITVESTGRSLGFASDIGRVSSELLDHLQNVDVLAIESNYCPDMQRESARPEFLKARIMGGRGHLSNQESARAIREIAPERVILLHLSRQCNTPERAMTTHASHGLPTLLSEWDRPSDAIPVSHADHRPRPPRVVVRRQLQLWSHAPERAANAAVPESKPRLDR